MNKQQSNALIEIENRERIAKNSIMYFKTEATEAAATAAAVEAT